MFNAIELRRIDLNLLVVFAAVFRERSVKRAAAQLLLGQPAVSMALGRLRELLGDELFVKVAGGVAPTAHAAAIAPEVERALDLVHGVVQRADSFDPARAERLLRLALPDDLELWLLPALVDELAARAPGVTVVVRASNWHTGLGLLERGEVDLALGVLPRAGAALAAEVLYDERFLVLFDPARLARPITLARFVAAPHVMVSISGDRIGVVDEALRARGRERRLVATVPNFAALAPLVKGRALLATLPALAATTLAASYGLATAAPPVAVGPYPVTLVWHARDQRDPALVWLRQRLRELVEQRVPPGAPRGQSPRRRRAPVRPRPRTQRTPRR